MAAGPDRERSSILSTKCTDTPSIPPELRQMEVGRGQADTYTATDADPEPTLKPSVRPDPERR